MSEIQPIQASVSGLLKEIRQIHEQYKREVPKQRRPWPASIQTRILELWRLGVSTHQISAATGLPCQTMYSWRQRLKKQDPGFIPVPIVSKRRRRDLQLSQLESPSTMRPPHSPTVTVVVGSNLRIEGASEDFALRLARELVQ